MRIETLSIKTATIAIFVMIAVVAIVLSLFAGSYFKRSALDAQMSSLSRVLEVATVEMQQLLRQRSFDLGMKLAHNKNLIQSFNTVVQGGDSENLISRLDDPIVSGFAGFSEIDLVKIRVYSPALKFIAESNAGMLGIEQQMPPYLNALLTTRPRQDRFKSVDALWLSTKGALHSSIFPLGGLHPVGYLEVIVNPVLNLEGVASITQTPVSVYAMSGELINSVNQGTAREYLPVEYILHAADGGEAFRIIGLEDVEALSAEMARIRTVTVTGFLLLALATLLLALWMFSRFMLFPVGVMVRNMRRMSQGKLDLIENKKALREFAELSDAFNAMASQVRMRTNDLERLLDLDESALLCFDKDWEMVFFNKSAARHFGYSHTEIYHLELQDLFADDIPGLTITADSKFQTTLSCRYKDGQIFKCSAVINSLDVMGQRGRAIALNVPFSETPDSSEHDEQRQHAVEQSLESLLAFAKNNPSLVLGLSNLGDTTTVASEAGADKVEIRKQAVALMNLTLTCWQRVLGKSKLELAEQSGIWPVYIDKSTPTTRTLDNYLSLDNCPQNPRSKRVVNSAEFVLSKLKDEKSSACEKLQLSLDEFCTLLSGVK